MEKERQEAFDEAKKIIDRAYKALIVDAEKEEKNKADALFNAMDAVNPWIGLSAKTKGILTVIQEIDNLVDDEIKDIKDETK